MKNVENLVLLLKTNFYNEKITSLAADGTTCLPGFFGENHDAACRAGMAITAWLMTAAMRIDELLTRLLGASG
jgi:hypothetical protein